MERPTVGQPTTEAGWRLEASYAELPLIFHSRVEPTPVRSPDMLIFNEELAASLGLDSEVLPPDEMAAIFSGNVLPPGSLPIAQAYAGHQYGHFTTLGDGRAILLGEQITPSGRRFDIQLKGSGPTRYSRGGDGRAAVGPMLREYLISEAMHALGIPTTRSLAVVATGERVLRQDGVLPGAVLARIADSHIRVGTFQWAAGAGGEEAVAALLRYTIHRHYPSLHDHENQALAFLDQVIQLQAALISRWMIVGFVHGVMNTDNMTVSGETIDYGPCAFMDAYDEDTVFSSIDRNGRYAYGQQPRIAQWNLARLAETLLPLIHPEPSTAIDMATGLLKDFPARYHSHWMDGMRRKLGLFNKEEEDSELISELLNWMSAGKQDYTHTFVSLAESLAGPELTVHPDLREWTSKWQARLSRQEASDHEAASLSKAANPVFIPRNHLVETALTAAQNGDLAPFSKLLEMVQSPFDYAKIAPDFRQPDPQQGQGYRTFCGT